MISFDLRRKPIKALVSATIIATFTVCSSCSSLMKSSKVNALLNDYCAPNISYQQEDTVATIRTTSVDALLTQKLNAHDLTLASRIGLTTSIAAYLNSTSPLEKLAAKQKITDQMLLFNTQVEAVVAELDCNGERFDQLARYLNDRNSRVNTRLTVASILAAAAITISTVLIKNDNVNKAINISGGVTGAGLGFALLNPKGKKVKYHSTRSLLDNVWYENNAGNAFPPALWRVMTDRSFSNSGQYSLIQTLKKRWLLFVFEDKIDPKDELRYFKTGGYFSQQDIQHLADMNNQLQASVRSVQQNMRSLTEAINRL